jgi:hypothetical protein
MVFYEVTAEPREEIREAYERYMRDKHVDDVLATGCFTGARFCVTQEGRYRASYIAASRDELDRYLETHATRLREDFATHFPDGIALSREVFEVLRAWPA